MTFRKDHNAFAFFKRFQALLIGLAPLIGNYTDTSQPAQQGAGWFDEKDFFSYQNVSELADCFGKQKGIADGGVVGNENLGLKNRVVTYGLSVVAIGTTVLLMVCLRSTLTMPLLTLTRITVFASQACIARQ